MTPGTRVRLHGSPYKGERGTIADPSHAPIQFAADFWPLWVHPDRDPARFVGFETHEVEEASDEITTSASVSVEGADAEHIAGMDPTTTLTLLDRLEADEAALERVRNLRDRWHRWVRLAGSMSGALSVPLPDVVSDLSRALDGEATDE